MARGQSSGFYPWISFHFKGGKIPILALGIGIFIPAIGGKFLTGQGLLARSGFPDFSRGKESGNSWNIGFGKRAPGFF